MGLDLCPSCGKLTDKLGEYTGWCGDCSKSVCCSKCGGAGDGQKYCRRCRFHRWLSKNADSIDRCIGYGLSFTEATDAVRHYRETNNPATCVVCGIAIPEAKNGTALFCNGDSSTDELGLGGMICKTAKNRFKRFIYVKGLDRETALKEVLTLARADVITLELVRAGKAA